MSPPILLVSYNLHPPSSTSAPPNLSTTTTHEIPLQLSNSQSDSVGENYNVYYAALRDAIAEAKDVTGRELTEWRDAIGDAEKEKVGSKGEEVGEEGEEVEEAEEAEEAEKEDQEVADEKQC